jgi:anti-sigma B factor antagonist
MGLGGRPAVVHVSGEVDVSGAAHLREALAAAVRSGVGRLVVDLEGVTFVDSTGLGVLVAAKRTLDRRGGYLELVVSRPRVARVLRISGLDRVFVVHPSLHAALLPTQRAPSGAVAD